jgi:hypothetical protein
MFRPSRTAAGAAAVITLTALVATLAPTSTAVAGKQKWHILSADAVAEARLAKPAFRKIDPTITKVAYRKGGEGNVEVCGYVRTEKISASRKASWSTNGDRHGRTLIMQYQKIVEGKTGFKRLKRTYLGCDAASFGYKYPDRVTVSAKYLKNKKQVRLKWVIYTSAERIEVKRAEGLAVQRAGGALIVTRAINRESTVIKPKKNGKLTTRQYEKYKRAARY